MVKERKSAPSYRRLRSKAIRDGQPFQDSTFPADNTSLFLRPQDHPQNVVWKRPQELVEDPRLYIQGAVACDVCHNNVANAWFVAACTALASEKALWSKVVPNWAEQDWGKNTAGIFRFCLWVSGAWVDIVIDDRLPTVDGKLLHSYSRSKNEFWAPLLEKAYAKVWRNKQKQTNDKKMLPVSGGHEWSALTQESAHVPKLKWMASMLKRPFLSQNAQIKK